MKQILDAISRDNALWADFLALCNCGGRRAGTESETQSLGLAQQRLAAIGGQLRAEPITYAGWRLQHASLLLEDGTTLSCNPHRTLRCILQSVMEQQGVSPREALACN